MLTNNTKRYVIVKKLAYLNFLIEYTKLTSDEMVELTYDDEEQYTIFSSLSDEEKIIYLNTITFPYDTALAKALYSRKLDITNFEEFHVDSKLISDKSCEYLKYSYLDLVDKNVEPKFTNLTNRLDNIFEQTEENSNDIHTNVVKSIRKNLHF